MTHVFPSVVSRSFRTWVSEHVEQKGATDIENTGVTLSRAQRTVRNFLGGKSPHRGLLLFHTLGSGKTCAAIAVAESVHNHAPAFVGVYVLSSASLEQNFRTEIGKCAPASTFQYRFLHFNGLTKAKIDELQKKGNPFDNHVIIIDEAHNITKSVARGNSEVFDALFRLVLTAENAKVMALTGTPMVNDAAELGYLISLVKGVRQRYDVQVRAAELLKLKSMLDHPCVDYHRVDWEKHSVSMTLLPEKYARAGDHASYVARSALGLGDNESVVSDITQRLKWSKVSRHLATAFPLDARQFDDKYLDADTMLPKNENMFLQRIYGYVSFFSPTQTEAQYPRLKGFHTVECGLSLLQTTAYLVARSRELEIEKRNKHKQGDDEKVSVYRSFTRRICNFVFPESIKRLHKSDFRSITESDAAYKQHVARVMERLQTESRKHGWLQARLQEHSPKFEKLLTNITRKPKMGTCLIYSEFRNVPEGLLALRLVLNQNGYAPFDWDLPGETRKRYLVYDPTDSDQLQMLHAFNNDFHLVHENLTRRLSAKLGKRLDNKDGGICELILISASGAEGLSLKNVRQVHILEPYWQRVRMQQVVGRARRAHSHAGLPVQDRDISVYMYVATFTGLQQSVPRMIFEKDNVNGELLTSDEHLLRIAMMKGRSTDAFQALLRRGAVDCGVVNDHDDCYSNENQMR